MADRIPLDHLTSDQYDTLHDELDALRAQLADTTSDRDRWGWYQDDAERRVRVQRERAEEAEAQLRLVDAMRQQNLDAAAAAIQHAEDRARTLLAVALSALTPYEVRKCAEAQRDRLRATLREVLDAFTTARRDDGVIAGHFLEGAIHPDDYARWSAALDSPAQPHPEPTRGLDQ